MQRRKFQTFYQSTQIRRFAVVSLGLMLLFAPGDARADDDAVVRWDIIRVVPGAVVTFNPDGEAWASTRGGPGAGNAGNPAPPLTTEQIKFTGSGTFKAPEGDEVGDDVTGGGTWQTLSGGVPTGRGGVYWVTAVVSWTFANFQTGAANDNIGDANERANGTAVLKIRFDDGDEGTLVVGCHGPGAPPRIFEGVTATKGFETYWYPEAPGADLNKNRTLFHVSPDDDDDDEEEEEEEKEGI